MWNNYTAEMQNPGRMADRQAEARAQRLAAEAGTGETRSFWLTNQVEKVGRAGASRATGLLVGLVARVRSAGHGFAHAAGRRRIVDGARLAAGHHRA
jgi:hypothetical protein